MEEIEAFIRESSHERDQVILASQANTEGASYEHISSHHETGKKSAHINGMNWKRSQLTNPGWKRLKTYSIDCPCTVMRHIVYVTLASSRYDNSYNNQSCRNDAELSNIANM